MPSEKVDFNCDLIYLEQFGYWEMCFFLNMNLCAYVLSNDSYFTLSHIFLLASHTLKLHKDIVMFVYYYFLTVWIKIKKDWCE